MKKLNAKNFLFGSSIREFGFDGRVFLDKKYEDGKERTVLPFPIKGENLAETDFIHPIGNTIVTTNENHQRVGTMELAGCKRFISTRGVTSNKAFYTHRGCIYDTDGNLFSAFTIDGVWTTLLSDVTTRTRQFQCEIVFEDDEYFLIQCWVPSNHLGGVSSATTYAGDVSIHRVHKTTKETYLLTSGNVRIVGIGRTPDTIDIESNVTYGTDYLLLDVKSLRYSNDANSMMLAPRFPNGSGGETVEVYNTGGCNLYMLKLTKNNDISNATTKPFLPIYIGSSGAGLINSKLQGQFNVTYDQSFVVKDGNGNIDGFYFLVDTSTTEVLGVRQLEQTLELHYMDLTTETSSKVSDVNIPSEYLSATWDTKSASNSYVPFFMTTCKLWSATNGDMHLMFTSSGYESLASVNPDVEYTTLPTIVTKFDFVNKTFDEILRVDNLHVGSMVSDLESSDKHLLLPFKDLGTEVVVFDTSTTSVQRIDIGSSWLGASVADSKFLIQTKLDNIILKGEVVEEPVVEVSQPTIVDGNLVSNVTITNTVEPVVLKFFALSGGDDFEVTITGSGQITYPNHYGQVNYYYEVQ